MSAEKTPVPVNYKVWIHGSVWNKEVETWIPYPGWAGSKEDLAAQVRRQYGQHVVIRVFTEEEAKKGFPTK